AARQNACGARLPTSGEMSLAFCAVCDVDTPRDRSGGCEVCFHTRVFGGRYSCVKCGRKNAYCPTCSCQPSCETFILTKEEENFRKLVRALNVISRQRSLLEGEKT